MTKKINVFRVFDSGRISETPEKMFDGSNMTRNIAEINGGHIKAIPINSLIDNEGRERIEWTFSGDVENHPLTSLEVWGKKIVSTRVAFRGTSNRVEYQTLENGAWAAIESTHI